MPELAPAPVDAPPLKLDFGCGKNKAPGFTGIDSIAFEGVDVVMDVRKTPWEWADESVDEVHASHFLEHLDGTERVAFFNELYRVMKFGAQARIITPSWSHERAYGDPTHKWPPVCGWTYLYLWKQWREANGPHTGYTCDFDFSAVPSYDVNDAMLVGRNPETLQVFLTRNINTATDMICTLTKVKR